MSESKCESNGTKYAKWNENKADQFCSNIHVDDVNSILNCLNCDAPSQLMVTYFLRPVNGHSPLEIVQITVKQCIKNRGLDQFARQQEKKNIWQENDLINVKMLITGIY